MSRTAWICGAALLGVLACAGASRASLAPSRERVETRRERDLRRVRRMLGEDLVRRRLRRLGMDPTEIEDRLQKLDDAELRELTDRLDQLSVGRGALGVVIGALVVAALVLLVIYLAERV